MYLWFFLRGVPSEGGVLGVPHVKEFKYLKVLFASEGTVEREISRTIGAAGAVLNFLYYTVVTKREQSRKARLSIYRSISVPILTYGHEIWVMSELEIG